MPPARTERLSLRVTKSGYAAVEKLRVEYDTDTATVIRALMAVALQHPRDIANVLGRQV